MLNKEQEMLLQLLIEKYGSVTPQIEDIEQLVKTKVVKKKKAQRANYRWSLEEIKQLADMHIKGIHTLQIARTMRRSHAAVKTMKSHVFANLETDRPPMVEKFWQQYMHEPAYLALRPLTI